MDPRVYGEVCICIMEQHPVPQNVTTFQFRLIGDMTIKQFGYLIGGAILGFIIYKLPLPFFITWPLAIFSAIGGFGLAFVPIEERPMDVWVLSFFKSIYSPTQYVWSREAESVPQAVGQKQPAPVTPQAVPALTNQPLKSVAPAAATQQTTTAPPRGREDILQNIFLPNATPPSHPGILTQTPKKGMFDWLFDLWAPKSKSPGPIYSQPVSNIPPSPTLSRVPDFSPPPIVKPAASVATQLADTQKKESILENKLKSLQTELEGKTAAESRILELQAQLTELLAEREKTDRELASLRKQSAPAPVEPKTVPQASSTSARPPSLSVSDGGQSTTTQVPKMPTIQIIDPGRAVKVGLPRLTTFPNIVTGIVKDKEKNLLPGVLVTVKDKDGVPLRALKTNRLGQFAASTQLPNGTYLVEIEDPRLRYTFDRAQITLNGTIVPALEIFAKSEKEITRAKLEKELFGTKTNE